MSGDYYLKEKFGPTENEDAADIQEATKTGWQESFGVAAYIWNTYDRKQRRRMKRASKKLKP